MQLCFHHNILILFNNEFLLQYKYLIWAGFELFIYGLFNFLYCLSVCWSDVKVSWD